jgi:hypothetical protein
MELSAQYSPGLGSCGSPPANAFLARAAGWKELPRVETYLYIA